MSNPEPPFGAIELGFVVATWPEGSQVRVYRWKGNAR